ncbi:TPA: DinI-like family protein [Klebsiella michiganensis]|jgi:DNA-damage-inducible protein I
MIVEISIAKEKAKAMPKGSMEALKEEMTRRVSTRYPDVEVIVKSASNDGLSVLRSPDKDDAKAFVQDTLQNAWESADDWFF